MERQDAAIVGADERSYPGLCFLRVLEGKVVKNRLRIDLSADPGTSRDAEVDRLIALGATRPGVGQGPEAAWVVLADPEGSEFGVLRRHETLIDYPLSGRERADDGVDVPAQQAPVTVMGRIDLGQHQAGERRMRPQHA